MNKLLIKVGMATAAATMVTGMAVAPANAGADSPVSSTGGATAKFFNVGDEVRVCDTQADGESVYAQYRINGGNTSDTSQHNGGNNTCDRRSTGNPAEGSEVQVRAARQAELAPDNYGDWKTGIA